MKDPRREYEAALADFLRPRNRWAAKGRLTYWGKAAGLTADEIISDARAAGVKDRDADIRRGWCDAKPKGERAPGCLRSRSTRSRPKPPPTFPRYVRDMVAAGGGVATSADLRTLSPFPVPSDGKGQTAAFLRSLFAPADVLHVFRDDAPTAGKPGKNLMPCREWLARMERGETMHGDLIVPNPFTGAEADTTDGRKSYIAQSCLARFPFVVAEFDAMPLRVQAAFWRGLLSTSPLAPMVAALVYSGGKSIHGLLHVGSRAPADWQTNRDRLRRLLAADPDPAFRADDQAMRPRTGTRLPGVRRLGGGGGRLQALLYLNPEAVRPRKDKPATPTAPATPRETPQTRPTARAGNHVAETDGRATVRMPPIPCNCATAQPQEPRGYVPFDELLAWEETRT